MSNTEDTAPELKHLSTDGDTVYSLRPAFGEDRFSFGVQVAWLSKDESEAARHGEFIVNADCVTAVAEMLEHAHNTGKEAKSYWFEMITSDGDGNNAIKVCPSTVTGADSFRDGVSFEWADDTNSPWNDCNFTVPFEDLIDVAKLFRVALESDSAAA